MAVGSAGSEIRGLIVKPYWLDKIRGSSKAWEIRGSPTQKRGRICLIGSGTGLVSGSVHLVDVVGPLSAKAFSKGRRRHRNTLWTPENGLPHTNTWAWVLEAPQRSAEPVPYKYPAAAVIWVDLTEIRGQPIALLTRVAGRARRRRTSARGRRDMSRPRIAKDRRIPRHHRQSPITCCRDKQPIPRIAVQFPRKPARINGDGGGQRRLAHPWRGHHPGEPSLRVGHEGHRRGPVRLGPAQQADFPGRDRRDENSAAAPRRLDRRQRGRRHRVAIRQPDHRAGIQQNPRVAHPCSTPSAAAKASSAIGAVRSRPGGVTTDPRKKPCNPATASA